MELDAYQGVLLVREAILRKKKDEAFQMYIALLPNMGDNYVPFEDFFEKLYGASKTNHDSKMKKEEVYEKVDKIFENYTFSGGED